ncbi:MAG: hypothetical protein O3A45_02835 [Proteobacteria bacterium]|nr:hypothetical protein [Pseudomonadota bacterium]
MRTLQAHSASASAPQTSRALQASSANASVPHRIVLAVNGWLLL